MNSFTTPEFWTLFDVLPLEVQNLAQKNYRYGAFLAGRPGSGVRRRHVFRGASVREHLRMPRVEQPLPIWSARFVINNKGRTGGAGLQKSLS